MTDDIFIGFTQAPEGLEAFLEKEGYEKESTQVSANCTSYISINHAVDVRYSPKAIMAGKEEVPNWRVLRFKHISVISDLHINFPFGDWQASEEASRLADSIMKTFNAVQCDPHLAEYYTGNGKVWPSYDIFDRL